MAKSPSSKHVPPHSKESEMMVLGSMLSSTSGLNTACDMLEDKDFYAKEHQLIYKALKKLYKEDKPADVLLLAEELKKEKLLELTGGLTYLTSLVQYAGTSAYLEEYAVIVKDKAMLRRMIEAAQQTEKDALQEKEDVSSLLDRSQARFFQIANSSLTQSGSTVKEILTGLKAESGLPFLKELEERQKTYLEKGPEALKVNGVSTHFADLDKMLNGFNPSNLMILAARPAMGKSALALNLAENICFQNNIPVGIFSLEMGADQLVHRMICSQAEVESEKIKTGSLSGMEYQRVVAAVKQMQDHTMIIDDQPGLKITELRSRARRMKEAHNIGFLIIDYLQLISGSGNMRSMENRQMEISEISRLLKTLARELNIPILCVAQLSRKVEERQGHRPMMSDLRESGSIEQDADIVMFLLRREYYDPYDKPGMAELIVAKNRHGGIGTIPLVFIKDLAQFKSYCEGEEESKEAFEAFSPSEE
jgi:replicative DNA helicase